MINYANKARENESRPAANATDKKTGNANSPVQFVNSRPEAIALKKLQKMANSSLNLRQLTEFQHIKSNVAQLVNIPVSFDGTPTQSMFAGPADSLTTTGLANCIAIVAYHTGTPSQGAVMRHYDTVRAFVNSVPDTIGGSNALVFSSAAIAAVAAAAAAQLVAQVPAAAGNIAYAVALGGVWNDVDPNTTRWKSRFNLISAIIAGVGIEPILATGTANFDVATSVLS